MEPTSFTGSQPPSDKSAGYLRITILKARRLVSQDGNGFSNPFVKVLIGEREKLRTATIQKSLDPVWEYSSEFSIQDPFTPLNIQIFHDDSEPRLLGYVTIRPSEVAVLETLSGWFPLKKQHMGQQVSGDIEVSLSMSMNPTWEPIFVGDYAMHNQNYSGAVKSFSIALDLHNWPSEIQADLLLHRASAQNEMSKPKLALQDLTRALKLNPNKSRGWYLLGKIVLQQGDASQAATVFERGLSANPTDAKCADALTKLQRELKRNSVTVKLDRIKELFNAKDYRQAISELTLGPLDIEPDNAQLLWMRSLLNLAAGDFELAESDILQAVRADPEWPKVDSLRSGELSKSGGKNPLHKTRLFYLKSKYLFYYKAPDASLPKGVVVLHENLPVESQKEAFYVKTAKRVMMITAKTASSCADWTRAMQTIMKSPVDLPASIFQARSNSFSEATAPPPTEEKEKGNSNAWRRSRAAGLVKAVLPRQALKGSSKLFLVADIALEGWLHKRGGKSNPSWKERWFVLKWQSMFYFKSRPYADEAEGVYNGALGFIQLDGAKVQDTTEPPFSFMIIPLVGDRIFFVKTASEADRRRWREVIDRAIKAGADALGATYRDRLASIKPNPRPSNVQAAAPNPWSPSPPKLSSPISVTSAADLRASADTISNKSTPSNSSTGSTPSLPPTPFGSYGSLHDEIEMPPIHNATERLKKYLDDSTPPSRYDHLIAPASNKSSPEEIFQFGENKLPSPGRPGAAASRQSRARAGGTFRRESVYGIAPVIPDSTLRSADDFDLPPTAKANPFENHPTPSPQTSPPISPRLAHSRNSEPDAIVAQALDPYPMSTFSVEDGYESKRKCCCCTIV